MLSKDIPSSEHIKAAHERIRPFIVNTPILTNSYLNHIAGCQLYFKCENLQPIGAFKVRGATNAILRLSDDQKRYGVATHSSGNHGQAVARAASLLKIPAHIVMPKTAAQIKRIGVMRFGGQIVDCDATISSRESVLAQVIKEMRATEVHPFNDYHIIAGQATAAKELFESVSGLDYVIAPIGGGGLLSGTALAARFFSPSTKVIGTEPEGADDAFRSIESGSIQQSPANSIADGLLATIGDKPFGIIKELVEAIITVDDDEIVSSMRVAWEELKMIVEPSGAVPIAGLLKEKDRFQNKKVGIIISGGNVDLDKAFAFFGQTRSGSS